MVVKGVVTYIIFINKYWKNIYNETMLNMFRIYNKNILNYCNGAFAVFLI